MHIGNIKGKTIIKTNRIDFMQIKVFSLFHDKTYFKKKTDLTYYFYVIN